MKKIIRVTQLDLVWNLQPLDSWAVAHLFYGVPREMKVVEEDIVTGDLLFARNTHDLFVGGYHAQR